MRALFGRRCAAILFVLTAWSSGQLRGQAAQPSAPSERHWTAADAQFMTGMIGHHAQAVMMARWAPTHGAGPEIRALCERIIVAQTDEIKLMQRWLREWGQPVPEADASMDMMPGMEGMHAQMPGMLTAAQLTELDHARGKDFDQLFLLYMIRHHQGAVTMVKDLVETPGAARDDLVFKFVSDINADQSTEIKRMSTMLAGLPAEATAPQ
jgi:uncharacterized protein (DUF305 family)